MSARLQEALDRFSRGALRARVPTGLVQRLELLHHRALPSSLRSFLQLHDAHVLQEVAEPGPWQILPGDPVPGDLCAPSDGSNLFEQVVRLDQDHYYGSFAIMQYAGRVLPIGRDPDSDLLFAALCAAGRVRIALMDREDFHLTGFVANDLHELALLDDPDWLPGDESFLAEYARNKAFACLLSNNRPEGWQDDFEDAWEAYVEAEGAPSFEWSRMTTDSAVAFHHLWESFFRSDDVALLDAVRTCRASAAPLIRDMAAVVEAIMAGQKTLGSIDDIHERRTWVTAYLRGEGAA